MLSVFHLGLSMDNRYPPEMPYLKMLSVSVDNQASRSMEKLRLKVLSVFNLTLKVPYLKVLILNLISNFILNLILNLTLKVPYLKVLSVSLDNEAPRLMEK